MSIFAKMMAIDRRIIYLALAITVAFPLFKPIGFPIAPDEPAVAMYDYVANLPEGSVLLYSGDFAASGMTELKPMFEVMLDLALQKKHKILLMALWPEGDNIQNRWAEPILARYDVEYGKDYISIGYIPSYLAFLDAARIDFKQACNGGIDSNRDPLDSFEIMQGIDKASDIDVVVSFGAGDPGFKHWVQYWFATSEVDSILTGIVAVSYPDALNAYSAGNLKGTAGGINGAATLEICHNTVGDGIKASDSQSFGHLAIIFFIIMGNVGYFGAKKNGEV